MPKEKALAESSHDLEESVLSSPDLAGSGY
jgi:hypothetical protein